MQPIDQCTFVPLPVCLWAVRRFVSCSWNLVLADLTSQTGPTGFGDAQEQKQSGIN